MFNLINAMVPVLAAATIALNTITGMDVAKSYLDPEPKLIEGYASRVTPVVAGQAILAKWNILKRTNCPGFSQRFWEGEKAPYGLNFKMLEPLRITTLEGNGVWTPYSFQSEIPILAPEGKLDLYIKVQYDCGDGPIEFTLGPLELVVVSGDLNARY